MTPRERTLQLATLGDGRQVPVDTTAAVLLERCDELARHTSRDDGLIERVYLSPEHAAVNALAARWMRQAGMDSWMDAAGNQCGRLEGADPEAPALLIGSHLDTVPAAGRFDGILGVLIAIAVVERIRESGRVLPFPLEVVAFGDEEGTRFGRALLGSRALAGTWDEEWWKLIDRNGVSLRQAFLDFGLDPEAVGDAARPPQDLFGYLEAHIEQGPYLEEAGEPLAMVSSIAGARRFVIRIEGKAGHAGTPFEYRRDALVGASELVTAIERIAIAQGLVATVGTMRVTPNAVNVVPGLAELSLDLRGESDEARDHGFALIEQELARICAERSLHADITQTHSAPAVHCAPELKAAIRQGIRATGAEDPLTLFSRAGHDGMAVAAVAPIAMLFLRCAGGVSHHPDESVTVLDVAYAIDAMESAVLALAEERTEAPVATGESSDTVDPNGAAGREVG